MMKNVLTILMLMASLLWPAMAQEVDVVSRIRLLEGTEGPAYFPVLDESGMNLLFLTDGGALKLCDLTGNVTTTISRESIAGGDACWGGDGKVYFVTRSVGEDHLTYRAAQCFDPQSRGTMQLTEARHGAVKTIPASRGALVEGESQSLRSRLDVGCAAWTEGSRVHVIVNGEERVFSPVDSWAGYLWASLSPDGRRVAFFAAGKGIVIIDLRGQLLAMLGNYEMPCWYNNDYIVAQNAKDDGHQFVSSQILLLKADGSAKFELTKPASMAMHPTCGGGKIVYSTVDGLLYQMQIVLHE